MASNNNNLDGEACLNYYESYIDFTEHLSLEMQKDLSRIKELDVTYKALTKKIPILAHKLLTEKPNDVYRQQLLAAIVQLQRLQMIKIDVIQNIQDSVHSKSTELEHSYKTVGTDVCHLDSSFEDGMKTAKGKNNKGKNKKGAVKRESRKGGKGGGAKRGGGGAAATAVQTKADNNSNSKTRKDVRGKSSDGSKQRTSSSASKTAGSKKNSGNNTASKKNKRKTTSSKKRGRGSGKGQKESATEEDDVADDDDILNDEPSDPSEPTYCLCDQISYGEMICCDNDLCPIEWFHFSCVSLTNKPKGKWFCPRCRGDRVNVMKPKAIFLKELEQYNKEREDRAEY